MAFNFKIRPKLILLFISTALIPVLIVTLVSSYLIFDYLQNNTVKFYTQLLNHVCRNIDFVYRDYKDTIKNMVSNEVIQQALHSGAFKSRKDEIDTINRIAGFEGSDTGFKRTVQERIEGYVVGYQTDRSSLATGKDYVSYISHVDQFTPDYDKLKNDPLFLELTVHPELEMTMGRFSEGIIPNITKARAESPVIIYPWYPRGAERNGNFSFFLVVILNYQFILNFYSDINELKRGTLYILDRTNSITSYNHPNSDDDEYTFDEEKSDYILEEGDDPDDPLNFMKFDEYRMLNTDSRILDLPLVQKKLTEMTPEKAGSDEKLIVTYKNRQYLTIIQYAPQSRTKIVYFHPVTQVLQPIVDMVRRSAIIALIFSVVIMILTLLFSQSLTRPVIRLLDITRKISNNDYSDYNELMNFKSNDELKDLAIHFVMMIKDIKQYQDQLLSAEKLKSELDIAARIQTCLLPDTIKSRNYDITAKMIPAESVGGDYYDIIGGDTSDILWLGIGDVSGHGLVSGLIMMMAQTAFNTILLNNQNLSTADLINRVNKVMYQNIRHRLGEDHFMTLSFLLCFPDGRVLFSGCHLDILVYRIHEKKVERIETSGIWLGLLEDISHGIHEKSLKLNTGDLLLLYTDGYIEAHNSRNEQYDLDRLVNKLTRIGHQPLTEIQDILLKDVFEFLETQDDDITILAIRKL